METAGSRSCDGRAFQDLMSRTPVDRKSNKARSKENSVSAAVSVYYYSLQGTLSLVCSGSAFSGMSRPLMMPDFSIVSSFLYMVIFHITALHPVYHRITLSPRSSFHVPQPTFLLPLETPLWLSRNMLHGLKDNSMLAKPLAACTYLYSILSELYRREHLNKKFFSSITLPSSCISGLLPPLRDSTITSRLRTPSLYPRPALNATLPLYITLYWITSKIYSLLPPT